MVFPKFLQIDGTVGRYWPLMDVVREWTAVNLDLQQQQRRQLIWFNGNKNAFIWTITLDGSPATSKNSKVLVNCAPWNIGNKYHCRDEWIVLFGYDGSEQGAAMEAYCKLLRGWITEIKSIQITVHSTVTTHKFVILADQKMLAFLGGQCGQSFSKFSIWTNVTNNDKVQPLGEVGTTWQIYTQQQREEEGELAEAEWATISTLNLADTTKAQKFNDYINSNLETAQKRRPLLDISGSLPDGTHNDCNAVQQWLGHLIRFTLSLKSLQLEFGTLSNLIRKLIEIKLPHVASKIKKKYQQSNGDKKKQLSETKWRLIGKDAIVLMQHFREVVFSCIPTPTPVKAFLWIKVLLSIVTFFHIILL